MADAVIAKEVFNVPDRRRRASDAREIRALETAFGGGRGGALRGLGERAPESRRAAARGFADTAAAEGVTVLLGACPAAWPPEARGTF